MAIKAKNAYNALFIFKLIKKFIFSCVNGEKAKNITANNPNKNVIGSVVSQSGMF